MSAFPNCRLLPGTFPRIEIDGEKFPAIAYTSYLTRGKYYNEIATTGLHLYCFPAYLGDRGINIHSGIGPFRRGLWRGKEVWDFVDIIEDFDMLLAADPKAKVIMRLHLDPPAWWEEQHPEACCQLADGSTLRQCFCSPKWIRSAKDAICRVLDWLHNSPYAAHLAGLHVAAGGTEEWAIHRRERFEDLNPDRLPAFRQWLKNQYEKDENLQKAWRQPNLRIDKAELPDINPDDKAGNWRDPEKERPVLDALRFHSDSLADCIAELCQVVKEKSAGRLLTGVFYGYIFPPLEPRLGHGALHRLLDCPDIDYFASPNLYEREAGLDWPPPAPTASIHLHGKVWMAENDTRTCCTTLLKDAKAAACPPGQYESAVWRGPKSPQLSRTFLRNNAARMLSHGYGGWWFDMWGGWFSHPELLAEIRLCQDLARRQSELPALLPGPEVALVVDEEMPMLDRAYGKNVTRLASCRKALAAAGAPYTVILRQDMDLAIQRFPLLWLMGLGELTTREESLLDKYMRRGRRLLVTKRESFETEIHTANTGMESHPGTYWQAKNLAELYRECGVHVYCEAGDILYAGGRVVALHAVSAGQKVIELPGPANIRNATSDLIIAENDHRIDCHLDQYQTAIFWLD